MNLFRDSNLWLALYDNPLRDLEELEKLVRLVGRGRVTLLLPGQVVNEVRRNRDKISRIPLPLAMLRVGRCDET